MSDYQQILQDLQPLIQGDVFDDHKTLLAESFDYSPLQVMPKLAVMPKHAADVSALVRYVGEHKNQHPDLSITPRSAGIDETGGPLNESIILDMTHMDKLLQLTSDRAVVQPALRYAAFDKETKKHGSFLPSYPASRDLCSVGGMVGNNSGGPKTLMYGKTENYIEQLKVVLSDGNEYTFAPLTKKELVAKMNLETFEGQIYRELFALIDSHRGLLQRAKPTVTKNSAGYFLWNIWNNETFDLTKLFVGSQGTLGITTEITFKLVKNKPYRKMLVTFLDDTARLSDVSLALMACGPEELEMYDQSTFRIILEHFPTYIETLRENPFLFGFQFMPEFLTLVKSKSIPQYFILAKFAGDTEEEVDKLVEAADEAIKPYKLATHKVTEMEKYDEVRQKTFYFFQKQFNGKQEVTFFDDLTVHVKDLSTFLPRLRALVEQYTHDYFMVAHLGNGDIHMVPFFALGDPETKVILNKLSHEAHDLVFEFHGTTTGEHNEGLIRTPFDEQMYGPAVYELFEQTKHILDPLGIFNPGKKVGSRGLDYALDHLSADSYKHKVKSL